MHPIFVGRQPIFDEREQIAGFELLFRSGHEDAATITDGDEATSDLLHSAFVDIGLPNLVGDRLAFVNLTRGFLEHDAITRLPPQQVVLEILEDVEIDADVVAAVRRLRGQGFRIALDDYQFQESHSPLVELADVVKLDVLALDTPALRQEVDALRHFGVELLAEKVETASAYQACRALGFRYFQGFHLSSPNVVEGQRLETRELELLDRLRRLQAVAPDPGALAERLHHAPDLADPLLRMAGSPACGAPATSVSLPSAIRRLGPARIRRLAMLAAVASAAESARYTEQAAIRARMGLLLARAMGLPPAECERGFVLGLLSGLDRVLGIPRPRILNELQPDPAMEQALLQQTGPLGPLLATIDAFEGPALPPSPQPCPVPPAQASRLYLDAIHWSEGLLDALTEA